MAKALAPSRSAARGVARSLAAPVDPVERGQPVRWRAGSPWWKGAGPRRVVSLPLYSLRREKDDPGIGKFTDLAPYYRDVLAKQGVDVVHLLPHFALRDQSPYAPVSLYALNEDYIDWSAVPEARPEALPKLPLAQRQAVDYEALRRRESAVAQRAYARFQRLELQRETDRGRRFLDFLRANGSWLQDYAEFMALAELIGRPSPSWAEEDLARARADRRFALIVAARCYAQWNAFEQFRRAIDGVHDAGGRLLFDVPMFRGKDGVDAWKHPELFKDLRTGNPGVIRQSQGLHEDWGDLALWNWTELKRDRYRPLTDPFSHWLAFGLDGARVDALHFAYLFGNGQKASGDEPGDDYASALADVFRAFKALPVAEAFEGVDQGKLARMGFVTVDGDWKRVSTHDDGHRPEGFLYRLHEQAGAPFAAYTLGDEWGDPFRVKEMRDGRSIWRYRIPLPSDPDYSSRVRADARPRLRALKALKEGDVWKESDAVWTALREAGESFVKRIDGSVQIWAASMDWFLEEWGRDTFVSLPGLLLSMGRAADARESLRRFAGYERGGLIPNKISGGGAEYNTVDGPLWFIQAVKAYSQRTGDQAFVAEMLPVLRRIAAQYETGTGYERYGRLNRIFMDADGLIVSPAQATWMDADPEGRDQPVTPRNGKAVEINALWYSSLRFLARVERQTGAADTAARYDALADRAKKSFAEKFWFKTDDNQRVWGETGGALRDVVEGDPHSEAIRPNMLFAVSHGEDLLSPGQQRAVVLAATRDLLTPYGLRTLSWRDSQYRERYETTRPPIEKDQAYHQGTAWPWLMGPYVDALARVRRAQGWDENRLRAEIRALMTPLLAFLVSHPEGSLPEVFDGGPPQDALTGFSLDDPQGLAAALARIQPDQRRGGTRSQAWSVAEATRVLVEYVRPAEK